MSAPKKGDAAEGKGAGRPPNVVELEQVTELAKIGCTMDELARVLGVADRTIRRWKADPKFLDALELGQATGRMTLRRMQWTEAQLGNATMLIWLGKQLLGQRDKFEHALADPNEAGGMTIMEALRLYAEIRLTHKPAAK